MPILYNLVTTATNLVRYAPLTFCHTCGSSEISRNYDDATHRQLWTCHACSATVGCYRDGTPLGYLANGEVRWLRHTYHEKLKKLIVMGYTNAELYDYVADMMHMDRQHCHSAWLTQGELIVALKLLDVKLNRPKRNQPRRVEERSETVIRMEIRSKPSHRVRHFKRTGEGYSRKWSPNDES